MKHSLYDYIVLGASLPGTVFAARKAHLGHSVLLINPYGFPGGSIAGFLNCRQHVDGDMLQGTARALYAEIEPEMFERTIVNPESLKYALQRTLVNSGADLCFHAVPRTISADEPGMMLVSLLAAEGTIAVRGKKILDASESYDGAALLGRPRRIRQRSFNLFITRPGNEDFLSFDRIRDSIRLSDGRYWISLRIGSQDAHFAEDEAHELLDEFRNILEPSGGRIDLLPLGIHTEYETEPGGIQTGSFAATEDIIGTWAAPSRQFFAASLLENAHEQF